MTPADLAAARWFRSKQRTIASVREVDRAPVPPAELVVAEVAYADGGAPDAYLLPLVDGREPVDGEGAWSALVAAIGGDATIPGRVGRFVASRRPAFGGLGSAALPERRLRVEQSNTSVVVGERLLLKLYRLLEPGVNPELEVGAFLAEVGFDETPGLAGSLAYEVPDGDPRAAAMLQAFVPARSNGWEEMLDHLRRAAASGVAAAEAIGGLTRRMHAALASRPDHPAFPGRVATKDDAIAWLAGAEAELTRAIEALSGEPRDRLHALAPSIRARFRAAFGNAWGDEPVTRIHGDYHLGQLLALDGRYVVIDFEGEPARPLSERRAPTSPLRDVAGMLRSFDYAARKAERGGPAPGFDAEGWNAEARAAFLAAYGATGRIVEAFELEKACYEVRYEAANRPAWLWLPLAAIERLAAAP